MKRMQRKLTHAILRKRQDGLRETRKRGMRNEKSRDMQDVCNDARFKMDEDRKINEGIQEIYNLILRTEFHTIAVYHSNQSRVFEIMSFFPFSLENISNLLSKSFLKSIKKLLSSLYSKSFSFNSRILSLRLALHWIIRLLRPYYAYLSVKER
jgi:hypothetical protein